MTATASAIQIRQRARRRARLALLLRELAARVFRWIALGFGALVILAGAILTPLPGHVGLPLLVLGLMVVLRYSFQARKTFIRWQRRHPKLVFPIRRLMRREPEVLLVVWQQMLRTEKLVLRKARWRLLKRTRKKAKRYVARKMAEHNKASA
ncbi:hypothetical protein [Caulobacter sp. RHG1]|uniref:hypothetical protein n=1 Tax=Caulobacter sp. (strain RHG1) TaxID=2545762 RepID=UPI00155252A5|nr:hypothetical protein [Caulobacter sp. RHG1]